MLEDRDKSENGLLMSDSADKAKKMRRVFYHCGSHSKIYSPMVASMMRNIKGEYDNNDVDEAGARAKIAALQTRLRSSLSVSGTNQRRVR